MGACPYNSRYFNSQRDPVEEQHLFPARTQGTVDKCDFCAHRVDAGADPACVATCPANARSFGNALDPDSRVAKMISRHPTTTLLREFGTRPSIRYLGGQPGAFRAD
jgi:molybdopterin-containing oxidoreductase family iron-sulfur binding subunit